MDNSSQIPPIEKTTTPVIIPDSPQSNSSKRLLIITGIIVALLMLGTGVGAFYLGSQSNNKITTNTNRLEPTEVPIVNLSPTSKSQNQSSSRSGWTSYRNNKYKIQFDYPNILHVYKNINDPENIERLELTQEDCEHFEGMGCGIMDSFQFEVKPLGNLSYQEWIQVNLFKESIIVTPEPGSSGLGYVSEGEYCYNRSKKEVEVSLVIKDSLHKVKKVYLNIENIDNYIKSEYNPQTLEEKLV